MSIPTVPTPVPSSTPVPPVHDFVPTPVKPTRKFPTWARYTAVAVGSWTIGAVMLSAGGTTPAAAKPLPAVTVTAPAAATDVTTTPEFRAVQDELTTTKSSLAAMTSERDSEKAKADALAAKPAPAPAAAAPAPAAPETFTMPAVVGGNLQLAQDTLQALGSYVMDQTDAKGLSRVQINDSNWKVCTQNPAPGAVVPIDTMVTLGSVKLTETCP